METKEERLKRLGDTIGDLQQWQRDILSKNQRTALYESQQLENEILINSYNSEEDEIHLTQSQANMLEKVLGDDFFITDEKVREVLEAVLECGFYYERDRTTLNLAREYYLKGKNWIKGNS